MDDELLDDDGKTHCHVPQLYLFSDFLFGEDSLFGGDTGSINSAASGESATGEEHKQDDNGNVFYPSANIGKRCNSLMFSIEFVS